MYQYEPIKLLYVYFNMYQLNYLHILINHLWIKFLAYVVIAEQIGIPYIEIQGAWLDSSLYSQRGFF